MNAKRAALVLAVLASAVVVGCGAPVGAAEPPPSAPPGGVVIVANRMAFDRGEVTVLADRDFPLLFENRESSPHNVSVVDPGSGQAIYAGEVFGGHDSRTYAVPAIPAGIYEFRCDVHPNMSGTLTAVAPSPAPAPG